MKYLIKISDKLIAWVSPIATFIEQNTTICILKNATSSLLFVLLLGSLWGFVVALLELLPESSGIATFYFEYRELFLLPLQFSFGMIGLYITLLVSFQAAREWKMETWKSMIASLLVYFLVVIAPNDAFTVNLGASSFFLGYFIAFVVSKTLFYFSKSKISLRKVVGVPASVADTYDTCIPMLFFIVLIIGGQITLLHFTSSSMFEWFMVFQNMLHPLWNHLLFACLFGMVMMSFWYAGLNGYSIIYIFVMPLLVYNLGLNLQLWLVGEKATHVLTPNFFEYFMGATGSGITGAVVLLAIFSKKKSLRNLGSMNIRSAVFTISEPIVFGIPLARNPYFLLPFVLGTPLITIVAWKVMELGYVNMPIFHVAGTPVILAHFLTTFDLRAIVLFFAIILIAVLLYYPFFLWYEKSVEEEVHSEEEISLLDELDLDF